MESIDSIAAPFCTITKIYGGGRESIILMIKPTPDRRLVGVVIKSVGIKQLSYLCLERASSFTPRRGKS